VAGSIPFEIQSLIVAALTLISVAISAGVSQGSSGWDRSSSDTSVTQQGIWHKEYDCTIVQ
jgi:hypothetical protein